MVVAAEPFWYAISPNLIRRSFKATSVLLYGLIQILAPPSCPLFQVQPQRMEGIRGKLNCEAKKMKSTFTKMTVMDPNQFCL